MPLQGITQHENTDRYQEKLEHLSGGDSLAELCRHGDRQNGQPRKLQ